MRMRRRGPGVVRVAATTAVVAGTAGAVSHRQQQKHAAAAEPQAAPPPAAQAAAPPEQDYMAELQQLAQLRDSGVITAADFEAKKQQILGI
jgi:membrane protease subunit (stomatin/prohibitin family)